MINCIKFVDEMVQKWETASTMLEELNKTYEVYGMKMNVKNTKCIVTGGDKYIFKTRINQEIIEQVKIFKQ